MNIYNDEYFDKLREESLREDNEELSDGIWDAVDFDSREDYEKHMDAYYEWEKRRFPELFCSKYAFEYSAHDNAESIKKIIEQYNGKILKARVVIEAEIDINNADKAAKASYALNKYEILW